MEWYWWIVIWIVLGIGVIMFIAGAHDGRFDERPMSYHPPDKRNRKDEQKWW